MNWFKIIIFFLILCQNLKAQTNTYIADSLDLLGEYEKSLEYRTKALAEKKVKENSSFLQAKWYYTKSCVYETYGGQTNHRKALGASLKAKKIVEAISLKNNKYAYFHHLILNRIYHQYGWTGHWDKALKYANENYQVLTDTFPNYHQKVLYILDDLGYINSVLEFPERANYYYNLSANLYKKYHPENIIDVYKNSLRIIDNYNKLGLKQKEFDLLNDAEHYWESLSDEDEYADYLFLVYKKLANWYAFYGNTALAESYLLKQEQLFNYIKFTHKETETSDINRRDLCAINESFIELYLKKNDYLKAKIYIDKNKQLLNGITELFRWDVEHRANLFLYEANLPDTNYRTAEQSFLNALDLIKKNKTRFTFNTLFYELELFRFYIANNKKEAALQQFDIIVKNHKLDAHLQSEINFQKAFLKEALGSDTITALGIKKAISFLTKTYSLNITLHTIKVEDLQEYYTFNVVDNLIKSANFYLKWYNRSNKQEHLQTAYNLFFLASNVFQKIYNGDAFNQNLYKYYKEIELGLLKTNGLLNQNKTATNTKTIETLENMSSKLTWSKFVYGKSRKSLKVPDSIANKENELKALLSFYHKKLYQIKAHKNTDTLKLKIVELQHTLFKHQEFIKKNYSDYYNASNFNFKLETLQNKLKNNQLILKYFEAENQIFVLKLSNASAEIEVLNSIENLEHTTFTYLNDLKTFNSDIKLPQAFNNLIQPLINTNKTSITIIPSASLSVLPFETLVPNYFESDKTLHYSYSLSLYLQQINSLTEGMGLNVGIFKAQHSTIKSGKTFLPAVQQEIDYIKSSVLASDYFIDKSDAFIKNTQQHNVLHLSLHTTINNEMPELSTINFASEKWPIGLLYNESIKADLAVLSACETAVGPIYKGEGVQSIARAFTYAGVPATVVSLWQVDDNATATLMHYFYKYLAQGKPKDLALKLAKNQYLKSNIDEALKHPYYWAGFVVSGNVTSFKSATNLNYYWLSVLAFPLLIFGLKLKLA